MTTEAKAGFYNGVGQAVGLFVAGLVGVVVGALLFQQAPQPPTPAPATEIMPMPVGGPVILPSPGSSANIISGNCRGY